jgi:hypothetical protein
MAPRDVPPQQEP